MTLCILNELMDPYNLIQDNLMYFSEKENGFIDSLRTQTRF